MTVLTVNNSDKMAFSQGMAIQAAKNNLFLDSLNFANRLSSCELWLKFSTPAPVGIYHLIGNTFGMSAENNSLDLVEQSSAKPGFRKIQNLETEKNEINAVCYLFGNQPGISLYKEAEYIE